MVRPKKAKTVEKNSTGNVAQDGKLSSIVPNQVDVVPSKMLRSRSKRSLATANDATKLNSPKQSKRQKLQENVLEPSTSVSNDAGTNNNATIHVAGNEPVGSQC